MPVNYTAPEASSLHPVAGIRLGSTQAGIRKADRYDLLLVEIAASAEVAGGFAPHPVCAAPRTVATEHHAPHSASRALVVYTPHPQPGARPARPAPAPATPH